MNIQAVVDAFDEIADRRGWRPLQTPRNLASAVALEAAELLQLFQWQAADAEPDAQQRERIGEEAADVLMYLLALCARQQIDIEAALTAKIAANRRRFLPQSNEQPQ
jgi:NTP pyrophosphatase (non-canonical NTP hydrolase)